MHTNLQLMLTNDSAHSDLLKLFPSPVCYFIWLPLFLFFQDDPYLELVDYMYEGE